jgi:hypothetical protein
MAEDPPRPQRSTAPVPEPRISSTEMEAVIARALELQARQEEHSLDDGISAAELVRIAGELGLAPEHVQQAIAEVRGRPAAESGVMAKLLGDAHVTVSRFLAMPSATARDQLDRYLQEREAMVLLRRLPDRFLYEKGSGVGAAVTRAAGMVGGRHPMLNLKQLDVAVTTADERGCFVALSAGLASQRAGTVAGVAAGGFVSAAAAATAGIVLAPPLALLGLPVIGGFTYLMRSSYRATFEKTRTQLESLLDRLEHRELVEPGPTGILRRFGF